MAYSEPFIKMSFGGSVSGEDVWSNSLSLGSPETGVTQAAFDSLEPQQFEAALRAAYIGNGGIANYESLSWIKLAYIGEDGKYIGEPKIYDFPTPAQGSASFNVPPQDSIVVSHLTEARRGLAYRGRTYLPAGFADATSNGKLAAVVVTSLLTRFTTLFNAINNVATTQTGLPIKLIVNSNVRTGMSRYITAISIGNLVDTQRRRRNRLSETYVDSALTS